MAQGRQKSRSQTKQWTRTSLRKESNGRPLHIELDESEANSLYTLPPVYFAITEVMVISLPHVDLQPIYVSVQENFMP